MPDETHLSPRLDLMTTMWSVVRKAGAGGASAEDARRALVLRYLPAVRRYIAAMTRSEAETDDLAQNVVVRLLKGDFSGADPNRGRFRDLLKTSVRNMVRGHWQHENVRRRHQSADGESAVSAEADLQADDNDEDIWAEAWRGNVLDLAWSCLEQHQRTQPDNVYYTVLRLRTDDPEATSEQLAEQLTEKTGRTFRADAVRQQLRRARVRFAELVIEQLSDALAEPTPERIEDELIAVGLFEIVRKVVPGDWKKHVRFSS